MSLSRKLQKPSSITGSGSFIDHPGAEFFWQYDTVVDDIILDGAAVSGLVNRIGSDAVQTVASSYGDNSFAPDYVRLFGYDNMVFDMGSEIITDNFMYVVTTLHQAATKTRHNSGLFNGSGAATVRLLTGYGQPAVGESASTAFYDIDFRIEDLQTHAVHGVALIDGTGYHVVKSAANDFTTITKANVNSYAVKTLLMGQDGGGPPSLYPSNIGFAVGGVTTSDLTDAVTQFYDRAVDRGLI